MNIGSDLRTGAHGRPGVDHRARADPGADVHVARHHHDSRRKERSIARDGRRNDAHAKPFVVALEGNLVVVGERADLLGFHLAQAEVFEDRFLRLLVDAPAVAVRFGDAHVAAVEPGDDLFDALGVQRSSSRIAAARRHSSSVGTRASRQ